MMRWVALNAPTLFLGWILLGAILTRRRIWVLFLFLYVLQTILNHLLKHAFESHVNREGFEWLKRPSGYHREACGVWESSPDGGMPSGHTQSLVFFATFVSLHHASLGIARGWLLPLWGMAIAVGYSRWAYECHTPIQIACGALLGAVLAFASKRVIQII